MEEHQGSPGTETKYCRGKSSSTHDTLRRCLLNETLRGFLILPVSASLSFHVILSFDDTKSHPRFHLYYSSAHIPLPSSLPTLPQLPLFSLFPQLHCRSLTPPSLFFFFCHVNSVQPESEHHKVVNPMDPFSLHFILLFSSYPYHSNILVSSHFQHPI